MIQTKLSYYTILALSTLLPTVKPSFPAKNNQYDCETSRFTSNTRHLQIPQRFLNTNWAAGRSNDYADLLKEIPHQPCFNSTFPTEMTVEEERNVALPCFVHNADFGFAVVSWWKEGAVREIAVGENVSDRRYSIARSIPQDWSLSIDNARLNDSGLYICQINSKQLREKYIHLKVYAKPQVPTNAPKLDVLVKDEATNHGRRLKSTSPQRWKPFPTPADGYRWPDPSSNCHLAKSSPCTLICYALIINVITS